MYIAALFLQLNASALLLSHSAMHPEHHPEIEYHALYAQNDFEAMPVRLSGGEGFTGSFMSETPPRIEQSKAQHDSRSTDSSNQSWFKMIAVTLLLLVASVYKYLVK